MTNQTSEQHFYGRRKGRLLRTTKSHLMATLLPQLKIQLEGTVLCQPQQFFGEEENSFNTYWLEIGFGGGEHLAGWAAKNPNVGFIGCEAFVNGVASLLEHIDNDKLTNVRIYPKPVQDFLKSLALHTIERAFVMFPDPWPKARHQKRRLVNAVFLQEISRILVPGGLLHLASDDEAYIEGALEALGNTLTFELVSHVQHRPTGWPATRYEQKALEQGKICHYLVMKSRALNK